MIKDFANNVGRIINYLLKKQLFSSDFSLKELEFITFNYNKDLFLFRKFYDECRLFYNIFCMIILNFSFYLNASSYLKEVIVIKHNKLPLFRNLILLLLFIMFSFKIKANLICLQSFIESKLRQRKIKPLALFNN